jgi:hypothetical protein
VAVSSADENGLLVAFQRINEIFCSGDPNEIVASLSSILESSDLHTVTQTIIINAVLRYRNQELLHRAALATGTSDVEFTSVQVPVGLLSYDKAALVGKNGFFYLVGGSNDVIGQYSSECRDNEDFSDRWLQLLVTRRAAALARNVHYHQIIIPEKISILPESFPYPVITPTRLLERLELEFKGASFHTSARSIFLNTENREACCKKMDSHLAPHGTLLIFQTLIRNLCGVEIPTFPMTKSNSGIGDLCFRLLGLLIAERFLEVDMKDLPDFAGGAVKLSEIPAEMNGHMGSIQVWKNDLAPIREIVVVFGNSFFSTVEYGQSTLSWWFSKWFSEFHFVWTNEVWWDYVDQVKPRYVVWQGVERFLPIVPSQ